MKVSELEGAKLDYWVARADSNGLPRTPTPEESSQWRYSPSTDWARGGPIIEREGISMAKLDYEPHWVASNKAGFNSDEWTCWYTLDDDEVISGPTPLIAAMRCFVASKFGEEVNE